MPVKNDIGEFWYPNALWLNDSDLYAYPVSFDLLISQKRDQKLQRVSPDVQFKELSLTKQTIRPRKDHEWIGKTIFKKFKIKQIINVKMPIVNKKQLVRKGKMV